MEWRRRTAGQQRCRVVVFIRVFIICLSLFILITFNNIKLQQHPVTTIITDHPNNYHPTLLTDDASPSESSSGQSGKLESLPQALAWASPHFNALFRNFTNKSWHQRESLLEASIPYYVYPSRALFLNSSFYVENLRNYDLTTGPYEISSSFVADITYEVDILGALLDHPHRVVKNEQAAELFVIPVSFGCISHARGILPREKKTVIDEIWENLKSQPAFVAGKPHVIVAMTYDLFAKYQGQWRGSLIARQGLREFYTKVKNVSVARGDELLATNYMYLRKVTPYNDFRGFEELFMNERPVTEYTFSVGLGGHMKHIPLRIPTMEAFLSSTYFVFYRSRRTPFRCRGTEYRATPIHNVTWSALPISSVGYDIPKLQWIQHFVDSKFCLVVRGDTPGSHALESAIKAGCIPVIICDWCVLHAPPLPATLDLRDFSVVIPEDDFMRNPHEALRSLNDLPPALIELKLKELAWAQRVVVWDHPNSLFVPAFTREAMLSFSRPASKILRKNY